MNDWVQRLSALRDAQAMEEALEVARAAAKQTPDDPRAAFALAQLSFETWRPAAELFAKARALVPGNADALRNHALALAAEGQGEAAERLLTEALRHSPGWLDGHRILSAQRITGDDSAHFDRSYAAAVKAEPANAALRLAWFQQHATLKDWPRAKGIVADARIAVPDHRGLALAALFLASESGEARDNAALFDAYTELRDPGLDLCQIRHHLRAGDVTRAEAIALRHVGTPAERMFWPYVSLCWRLMDDKRAGWLDGDPPYGVILDLNFSSDALDTLAQTLRGLHRMKAPYPEQSVRGGTQTDRQLFFNPDPAIQAARAKISTVIEAYIEGLPAPDAHHPLLSVPRDTNVRFEGSWSVRLMEEGFHSAHTHVRGWISSAFYVALPDEAERGAAPAGQLSLGTPPPELGLPLEPYRRIVPKPGRLALFPSTMWHSTEPFQAGERLTIAFDVKIPPQTGR